MDVLVHTSLREGLPRVLLQGGAVGKPVVSFALDGAPEAIEEGVSGHLARPMDSAAVAEKVLSLLSDPARRRRLASRGDGERVCGGRRPKWWTIRTRFMSNFEALAALVLVIGQSHREAFIEPVRGSNPIKRRALSMSGTRCQESSNC